MPIHVVMGPDGKEYQIPGPPGSTKEEAQQRVNSYVERQRESGAGWRDKLIGAANAVGSGASLGFSDEAAGLIGAIPALVPGGESPVDAYTRHRDAVRGSQNQFRTENPYASLGLEMAGGLASGGVGLERVLAQQLPRAANVGISALAGGLSGAGQAETLADVPQAATMGAGMGTVMAPVAALAGRAMTAAGRGLVRLWRGLVESNDATAARQIRELLADSGMDAQTFAARMNELGPDGMVADLDINTQRKLRGLAAEDPGIDAAVRKPLDARQEGAAARITGEAQGTIGSGSVRLGTALKDLDTARRAAARQQYGPIYDAPVDVTPELESLMKRPSIAAGYKAARRRMADAGEVLPSFLDADGNVVEIPTLGALDQVKQGLDDVIDDNLTDLGRATSKSRSATIAKRALVDYLDSLPQGPEYAAARSTYAGYSALERAAKRGANVFKEDADLLFDDVDAMGATEKQAFKLGVFNAIRDEIESVKETGNAASRVKFSTPKYQRRIRIAFDSDDEFNEFMDALKRETNFAETRQIVEGGSPTARIERDKDLLESTIGGDLTGNDSTLFGTVGSIARRAWEAGAPTQGRQFATSQRMSDYLTGNQLPPSAIPQPPPRIGFNPFGAAIGAGAAAYDPYWMSGLLGTTGMRGLIDLEQSRARQ